MSDEDVRRTKFPLPDDMPATPPLPEFLFLTCQAGAEQALKDELAREWPTLRFAYSRPGFVTFKFERGQFHAASWDLTVLRTVFARAGGFSLGRASGDTVETRVKSVAALATGAQITFARRHVWERDGAADMQNAASDVLRESSGDQPAQAGDWVLDVVLVSATEWWVGYHRAHSEPSRWPGGCLPITLPADAVSRAYLKMEEALEWSRLPLKAGQKCVEVGSAPGGAAQALLNRGLWVTGIDPAEMHALVLQHPHFTHIRRRSKDVPHETFRGVQWLTVDVNQPPNYTLDVVEAILKYPGVHLQGLLLTLKLRDWSLAAVLPENLARIKSWGFTNILAKQLVHNRQEVCVVVQRRPERI